MVSSPKLFLHGARSSRSGFSLVELLVVVAVLGVLAAVAWPSYSTALVRARLAQTYDHLRHVRLALDAYRVDHYTPPVTRCGFAPWCGEQYVALTTPLPYLADPAIKRDPFSEPRTLADVYFPHMDFWYYGSVISTSGKPVPWQPHAYLVTSWGPDGKLWYGTLLAEAIRRTDGIRWMQPYTYSVTNGLISNGDIVATSGGIIR